MPTAVLVLLCIGFYLAVGVTTGMLAGRLAFRWKVAGRYARARTWGWWTFLFWPIIGPAVGTWLAVKGIARVLDSLFVPD